MSAATIDERIVEMTFKGQTFADGVKNTITALNNLKNGLNSLKGSENDINSLDAAGKKFSLSGMANGVQEVASRFNLLKFTGLAALGTIVSKATSAGISLVKSLTIDPIKAGLDVYETKINAIQTVLANTSSEGTKLADVTAALKQLNQYANLTVYNFGQMAQNVGTFTAAGVDLKTSVASIKGIANLAALSGSSAEQASTAMYQLSQAIAAGSVKLQDWNSVVNAGLGGKVFQNALEQTAKATGVNIDAIIKKAGSFRNSLQQGWLTSKILTQTLSTFTGDLTAQQLKSMGYSQQQIKLILQQSTAAKNAATQIKTITQLQAALREEVATAWSTVWESLIGNIGQATTLLSAVHNTLETLFTKPIYDFDKLLNEFDKLGGRDAVIQIITNAFHFLGQVLSIVGSAFREVFPPVTVQAILNAVVALQIMSAAWSLSSTHALELKQVLVGVFSIFKIVVDVVEALVGGVTKIGPAAASSGLGLLGFLARIAQLVTKLKDFIEQGGFLVKFFNLLGNIIAVPVRAIGAIVDALGGFSNAADSAVKAASPFVQKIGSEFSKLADAVIQGIKSGDFTNVIAVLNGTLFAGVLVSVKKFISGLTESSGEGGGLFSSIKESFEGLTGALKQMQTTLKSQTLKNIAIAVAILAASLLLMSLINVANLTKSIVAMTILFNELVAAMTAVAKIASTTGVLKMAAIGVALNLLATAIVILAGAVAILSRFSWSELERGLGAIAILLAELVIATQAMSANTKGLVASAYAMEIMAVALNILAQAVKQLGAMKLDSLEKGIGSIAVLLLLLTAFQHLSGGENLVATAVAMLLVGAALEVITSVIAKLGALSLGTLIKGIASLAAVLAILVIAMNVMEGSIVGAAALIIAAAAILILSNALNSLGGESWGAIAKALVLLAGALVLLAAAAIVMEAGLPGAVAMVVMAAAIAILTPALLAFSKLSWEGIAKALVTLAGTFVVIGAAGILLTPVVAILLGLGAAILVIGSGIFIAGVGVGIFAAGLSLLAVALAALGSAIAVFVTTILGTLPAAINQVTNIATSLADGITKAGPAILIAITAVLLALLGAIAAVVPRAQVVFGEVLIAILNTVVKYAPRVVATFYTLVLDILNAIAKYYPKFVSAGLDLIVNMLNGIARQIPRVANAATNVIIAFINAIANSELRIAQAGVNMIINLINGIANEIRADTPRMRAAGENLASAIIDGMTLGIFSGSGSVASAARSVASAALNAAKSFLGINSPSKEFEKVYVGTGEGAVNGIRKSTGIVATAAAQMGAQALSSTQQALSALGDAVSNGIDVNPTITPVLDLTQAKAGFDQLNNLSKSQLIAATASTNQATSISAQNAAAANAAGLVNTTGTTLNYTQNNYSPTALDSTTLYRQTKNQLSITKGALSRANSG